MKFLSTLVSALGLLSTAAIAAPQLVARDLSKPSEDSFYTPPSGFEDKPLGTILKHRPAPSDPGVVVFKERVKETIQILYRTSNSSGGAMATVANVYIPYNGDPSKLLAYSTAEDATYMNCAPSYALQFGSSVTGVNTQVEMALISSGLEQGWYVVTSDYEGPQSAYIAGILAGHGVLDSIRATLNNPDITGVNSDATVTLWGYSGGSLASAWAAELQPKYYKELEISGVAVGGLVPNISLILDKDNKGFVTGLIVMGIIGLSNEYPEFAAELDGQLKPEKKDEFYKHKNECLLTAALPFALQDWTTYFTKGKDVLNLPIVKKVIDENNQGKEVPKTPFMIYHTKLDAVAPFQGAEQWYENFCARGVNIEFNTDYASDHVTEGILGLPLALSWLKDRYDGKPINIGCKKNERPLSVLSPDSLKMLPSAIVDLIFDLLGKPIGLW